MKSKTSSPASSAAVPPRCVNCRLRRTETFTPVKPDTIDFIEEFRSGTTQLDAGATIIREQQPNGKLFTLYSGWAFRYKSLSDGRRQILNFLLPGDLVGLQQKFSDNSMHGVEAVTDVSLCAFPRDGLWDLFRRHPELGYDITWLSARGEGFVDDNLLTTGRRNATERVAMLLMHLYRRLQNLGLEEKDADGKGGSIEWPINQQHIADNLGLSLVHTNKTLRRLRQLGLHEIEDGRLRLRNPKALERVADYYEKPRRPVPLL
jgi:CRP/FNR family transcriptional regulator, anaerobic regulatory protein